MYVIKTPEEGVRAGFDEYLGMKTEKGTAVLGFAVFGENGRSTRRALWISLWLA